MISYLKIEIFAYDLFHTVWFKDGLISRKYDATQIYKNECLSHSDYEEVCDKLFYNAVLCRRIFFQTIFTEEIIMGKDRYWDSVSGFNEYIQSTCNRYDWFGCLTVFERMLATCAFALNLCFYNHENENVDIIKYGHICWAMYFDEFSEEFYEQGGWSQLKNVADSYTLPLLFLHMCLEDPENALFEVSEAIGNYNSLKKTSIIGENETVSKLWINYRIKNLHSPSKSPVELEDYDKCLNAEHILNELKHLCNPRALEVLQYDEECSERSVFDSDSFYIPLTPVSSQESINVTNSLSVGSEGIGKDAFPASSSVDDSEFEIDNNNPSYVNDNENIISSIYSDDISNGCLDIPKQPIEFESICIISDQEQDQNLSRSMTKMHLNYNTLELEETTLSKTDFISSMTDTYSEEEQFFNSTDRSLISNEVMSKQCQMLEDSLDANGLPSIDTLVNALSVTVDKSSDKKRFKEDGFMNGTIFSNTVFRLDNKISIFDWNEKNDLEKKLVLL